MDPLDRIMPDKLPLPEAVQAIYDAVAMLEEAYPGRRFTPDGHLVGSIGEVIAAEAFDLELLPSSSPIHDARAKDGTLVQIKTTGGTSVAMTADCQKLLVLKIIDPTYAVVVYFGSGDVAWAAAGKLAKNGQRRISLKKLQDLASEQS